MDGAAFREVPEYDIANDFDMIALEAAVRLKEQGSLDEVVAFGIASSAAHLQKALAMGADRAVYAACSNSQITPQTVVRTALSHFQPDNQTIWILGKIGVNYESAHTPQLLAAQLGCPCLCSAFRIARVQNEWLVHCEDNNGTPILKATAPFVVTADLRLAEPRFPSLPNIIKAKRKPFETIPVLHDTNHPAIHTLSLASSADVSRSCTRISPDDLIHLLSESAES